MVPEKIRLKCRNPECAREFSFKSPVKPGNYKVACPYCKTPNSFAVKAEPVPEPTPEPVGPQTVGPQTVGPQTPETGASQAPQASAAALGGPALDGHSQAPQASGPQTPETGASQAPQASAPALGGPALDGHSQAPQASAAALGGPALDGQQQPAPQPAPQQPRQEGSPAVSQGQQSAPKPQQPKLGLQEDGTYRLQCASCGQLLVVPKVKPGINRLTCPKCKNPNQFEIQPSEEDLLKCQCCGAPLTKPAADGLYSVECDQCQQPYNMIVQGGRVTKISARTKPGGTADRGSLTPMVLSTGGFFKKTTYILYKGTHFIGRWDENENSDFALKDNTVSRRSVRVDVNQSGNGLVYKMTILKATNPIYHNKKQLVEGDIVYLNYGDVLQLGNTTIKVQKQ